MDFTALRTQVIELLQHEQRLSYRALQRQFALDDADLEALKDDRTGQHSIRLNDQWRVCFRWQGQDAFDVEIVDYH